MIPTNWDRGRALVELDDGTLMSIITPERNEFIREAAQWSPSYLSGGWTLMDAEADEDSYEVSFRKRLEWDPKYTAPKEGYCPEGWDRYYMDDDGDPIYARVPREVVHAYLDEHGGKEVDE